MDFKEKLRSISGRIEQLKANIQTEEATKTAFVMPFIQALGYDIFNPLEVVPEYITDIGIKKGEKIDYAIFKDGQPSVLIECKHWNKNLDLHDGQLLRYFHVSKARFGVLTNGIRYRFFTDLEEANKMDEKPFFEFDITELRDAQVEELKKFHKDHFEVDAIINTASQLKYINDIKNIFNQELKEPSDDFVKFFITKSFQGRATEKVLIQFRDHVKRALNLYLSDHVTDRIKAALKKEEAKNEELTTEVMEEVQAKVEKNVETTVEEMEGYFMIKSILRKVVSSERVTYRDNQTYFAILLDDNNRKPLARLHLNSSRKYLTVFDAEKQETKHEISSLDDIYKYAELLEATPGYYQ